ncbi:MAG TPA: Wzz/FepE/Etk N-terminal domain-containing protein [Candidatus Angelobacter sp.]|nr:Wzz/FepE/Etk N-terminal domain-containing protein [Candidatus Angelobacter sp.]
MEARGPATVPIYAPSIHPELEKRYSPPNPEPEDKKGEKLWALWRSRRFIWGVAWKTLLASIVLAFVIPAHYKSSVRFVPAENSSSNGSGGSMMGLLSKAIGGSDNSSMGFGLDAASLLGAKTPGAFYVEVLKSRSVQDRLINRFDLRARYRKATYFEARKKLTSFTDIEEDKKSGVITLTVTDYEPKIAAQIANAYIEELNRLAVDLNTSSAHRERQFLEERLATARQDLARASASLSQFTSKNSMVDPQNEGRAVLDAAARMQGELIASGTELKGLQQIYSDDNIRVRMLKARMAELRSQLGKLVGPEGETATQDKVAGIATPYPSMHTLPGLGSRYADLYREAKIQEAVYSFVTQQFEMAKIQEAKELPIARVMDAGVAPEKRSSPIRSLIVAGSVLGAILLACLWVMGKNRWEHVPADDPYRLLAADVAGEVRSVLGKLRGRSK